ncbi:sigma intracellular receptor 2 [Ochotona princeps]|uniref:sigma intracellular receptor 2 n=1 Tax=Ochotona princeps TaxID=9978 RepID=UPI002714A628|nr:sigma intracellular receptor 2 [Ochotona princeps]
MGGACATLRGAERQLRRRVPTRRADCGLLPVSACAAERRVASSAPNRPTMRSPAVRRFLECLLGLYFVAHIPITLCLDLQMVLPRELFAVELRNLLQWYAREFKDPLLQDPPEWFKSFVFCELVFQLPFFPFAAYAFFKGSCKWVRTPAIIYSAHTVTTVIPILATLLFDDFPKGQGPGTFSEKLILISVYLPYLLIPLVLLLFMLRNPYYKSEEKRKKR